MDHVRTLFDLTIAYGKQICLGNHDGLAAWNKVKAYFPDVKFTWRDECTVFYEALKSLGVKGDDEDDVKAAEWESHHFLLQHGRIVFKNKHLPPLSRLMQIAYNEGQLQGHLQQEMHDIVSPMVSTYDERMLAYYTESNMRSITVYIRDEELMKANETIASNSSYVDACSSVISMLRSV